MLTFNRQSYASKKISSVAIAATMIGISGAANAQSLFDEIIVTAQKRAQNVKDVGISITSFSGDQLQALGYTSTADIVTQTPSLRILSYSPALTVFNIRGVSQNDFADHYEGPVAVFADEAYISAQGAVDTQLVDIERVEVLRGPQGTLFGRNATGGLIHYISRKPGDQFEGFGEITVGSYNQLKLESGVSIPLSDKASTRFSFGTNQHDGWVKNTIGEDLNESDGYVARGQILLKPSDDFDALVKVQRLYNNETTAGFDQGALFVNAYGLGERLLSDVDYYGTCAGCDPYGYLEDPDPWTTANDVIGRFKRETIGVTTILNWWRDNFTLTSITDYLEMDKYYQSDSDGSPTDLTHLFYTSQEFQQISQELRLHGDMDRLRWVIGAYFLDIDSDNESGVSLNLTLLAATALYYETMPVWHLDTRSWAFFGQAEWDIAPAWTLIGGARYTKDRKTFDYLVADNFGGSQAFNSSLSPDAKRTFDNVSVKAELDWKPNDDILVYASFNRGHKGGNFAAPLFMPIVSAAIPHDEEVMHAFEIGVKSTFLDGRARLNASLFYYDYKDYQAFSFSNLTQAITNVDATIKGLEVELTATPIDGLDLMVGVSALDGKAKDVQLPSSTIADREMPMTPPVSINFLARYAWPAFGGTLSIQADGQCVDDYYFHVLNAPQSKEDSHFVGNARLTFMAPDDRWQLASFVKNVFENKYRNYTNDISSLGYELDVYAPPRWVGVSLLYKWN